MLMRIKQKMDRLFAGPSLDEIVSQEIELGQRELMQSEYVIRMHKFQSHMTRAKLNALKEWDDQHMKGGGNVN